MSWARLSAHADRAALDHMGGVSVIAGAASGRGFLEENYELIFDGQVRIVPWLLKIRTAEFGHLDYNTFVVANGIAFKAVRGPEPVPGSEARELGWSMVELAKVDAPEETVVILDGDPGDDPITEPTDLPVLILDGSGS
jgi:hypothetical protein